MTHMVIDQIGIDRSEIIDITIHRSDITILVITVEDTITIIIGDLTEVFVLVFHAAIARVVTKPSGHK